MAVDVSALVARFGGGRVSGVRERKDTATTLQTDTQVVAQAVLATGDLSNSSQSSGILKERNTELTTSRQTQGDAQLAAKAVLEQVGSSASARMDVINSLESTDSPQKLPDTSFHLHALQEKYGESILRASLKGLNLLDAFDAGALLLDGEELKGVRRACRQGKKNNQELDVLYQEKFSKKDVKSALKKLGIYDGVKTGIIDLSESIDSIRKLLDTPSQLHILQEKYGESILRTSLEGLNLLDAFDADTLLLDGEELKKVRQACRQHNNHQVIDACNEQGFSRREVRSVLRRLGIFDHVNTGISSVAPHVDVIKQIIRMDRWMAHLEHEFGSELVQTILERHAPDQTELLRSPEQLEVIQTECTERNQKQFNICKARFLSLQIPEEKNPQEFLELKAKLERISLTSLSAEDQKFLRNALCLLNSLENFKSRLTDAFDTMIFDWSETIKDLYGDRTLELIKLYKHMDPSQVKDSFINSHLVTFLTKASHAAVMGDLPEEFGQKTEAIAIKHQSEIDTHLLDLMNSYGRYHEWVGKYQQYIIAPYNQGNESAGKIGFGICYTLSVHSARELLQNPDIPSEELSVGFTRDVQSLHRDFKLNKNADSLHQKAGIKPVLEGQVKFRPGDAQKKIRACSPMFDRSYGPRVGIFHVEDSQNAEAISHTVLLQMDHSKNRFIDAGCGLVDFGDDRETCIEAFASYLSLVYWGLDKMSFTLFERA